MFWAGCFSFGSFEKQIFQKFHLEIYLKILILNSVHCFMDVFVAKYKNIGKSSNGRTADFDSVSPGSNPGFPNFDAG